MLQGEQRTTAVEEEGCCVSCGFKERLLLAHEDVATWVVSVHCEECFANKTRNVGEHQALAYLPELSVPALAHFVRVCAWYSFATRCGSVIEPDDLIDGMLPSEFGDKQGWERPMEAEPLGRPGLTNEKAKALAKQSYAFIKARIEVAEAHRQGLGIADFAEKIGEPEFSTNYRILPISIPVGRIRSWGKGRASFARVARKPSAQAAPRHSRDFKELFNK